MCHPFFLLRIRLDSSTQLEEDLSREDKSTNTDCILLTKNFMWADSPILSKESFSDIYKAGLKEFEILVHNILCALCRLLVHMCSTKRLAPQQ